MTLNASGPLSLGGSTVGQSINLELGQSATAVASINAANFRSLAGVASGQISISNFYGKSNTTYYFILSVGGGTNPSSYYDLQMFDVDSSDNYYAPFNTTVTKTTACTKVAKNGSTAVGATYTVASNLAAPTQMCVANNRVVMATVTVQGNWNDLQIQLMSSAGSGSYLGSPTKYRWTPGVGTFTNIYVGNYTNSGKDSSGNAYVVGTAIAYTEQILCCCVINYITESATMVLAKINTSNGVDYIKGINTVNYNGFDRPTTPLVRTDGQIVLGGGIPGGTTPVSGIMLFNPSTNAIVWKNRISFGTGWGNYDTGLGTAQTCIDGSNNVYIAGSNARTTISNCYGTTVTKFDSSGNVQWATQFLLLGGNTSIAAFGIACDSVGNTYTLSTRNNSGAIYTFLVKMNSSGTVQWQLVLSTGGTQNTPNGRMVKILADGSLAVYYSVYQSNAGAAIITLPNDGSKVGTFTVNGVSVTVATSALTVLSPTVTSPALGNTGSYSSSFTTTTYGTNTVGSATVTPYVTTI